MLNFGARKCSIKYGMEEVFLKSEFDHASELWEANFCMKLQLFRKCAVFKPCPQRKNLFLSKGQIIRWVLMLVLCLGASYHVSFDQTLTSCLGLDLDLCSTIIRSCSSACTAHGLVVEVMFSFCLWLRSRELQLCTSGWGHMVSTSMATRPQKKDWRCGWREEAGRSQHGHRSWITSWLVDRYRSVGRLPAAFLSLLFLLWGAICCAACALSCWIVCIDILSTACEVLLMVLSATTSGPLCFVHSVCPGSTCWGSGHTDWMPTGLMTLPLIADEKLF